MLEDWDQCCYMQAQIKEIEIHKWIESEKVGHDLGCNAVRDWINEHAKAFREYAEKSGLFIK